jgi:hypothetical protein
MWCITLEQDVDAQIKLLTKKKDEKDNLTYQQAVVS